jgi:hypothetical protein
MDAWVHVDAEGFPVVNVETAHHCVFFGEVDD